MGNTLDGRTAVVTGGSSGIGLATARLFAEEGAGVVIVARDEARLLSAAESIGASASWVSSDLGREAGALALAGTLRDRDQRIDVLFANVGASNAPELFQTGERDFDLVIDTNLKSAFFTVVRCFELLNDGASVILSSSVAAGLGRVGDPLYSASKAAVRSLGRGLAAHPDFLRRRIRVNVLSFGAVATPMTDSEDAEHADALEQWAQQNIPVRRWASPSEAAQPALFLASDASSYMTGSELAVDGGLAQL